MSSRLIVVKIAFDTEARVWFVESCTLPGLSAESTTADQLMTRIPDMIADLLEENGFPDDDGGDVREVAVEIIASQSSRVRLENAA
jgi:hypothetical protein